VNHLPINLLNPSEKLPIRSVGGSVGYDICTLIPESVTVYPWRNRPIGFGAEITLEQGYAAFLYARSGLGIKCEIVPANGEGIIDSDCRREIMMGIENTSSVDYVIYPGERIAQIVISRCNLPKLVVVDALDETGCGSRRFGFSSGKT